MKRVNMSAGHVHMRIWRISSILMVCSIKNHPFWATPIRKPPYLGGLPYLCYLVPMDPNAVPKMRDTPKWLSVVVQNDDRPFLCQNSIDSPSRPNSSIAQGHCWG